MNSIRVRFVRGEEVKFISHLDLMQVFERALRRAHLPIAYSQGYNPHPHIVFGLPLSVGVSSQTEYADFEMSEEVDPQDFMERLNPLLPKGLRILAAALNRSRENIMATIGTAEYQVLFSADRKIEKEAFESIILEFLSKPEIIVKKEGKKGLKDVDIKPMILKLHLTDMADEAQISEEILYLREYIEAQKSPSLLPPSYNLQYLYCLSSRLSAGSVANLKPELLFNAFNAALEHSLKLVKIHRTGLYIGDGNTLKNPLDADVL